MAERPFKLSAMNQLPVLYFHRTCSDLGLRRELSQIFKVAKIPSLSHKLQAADVRQFEGSHLTARKTAAM
ncbi:hypothetical protein [Mesorhizobium sp. 10J20-29]